MAKKQDTAQAAKKSGVLNDPIRNQIITAVVCLALGVTFIAAPDFIRYYCGYVIGGLLCLIGVVYIILYFARKIVSGVYRTEFAAGSLFMAAGIYVIVASLRPDTTGISITLRMIVTVLGVLLAADGAMKLQYALDLARMQFSAWWVELLVSLLGVALGVMTALGVIDGLGVRLGLMGDGFLGAMLMLGSALCVNALLDGLTAILVAVRNRSASAAEPAPAPAPEAPAAPAAAPYPYYDAARPTDTPPTPPTV